MSAQPHVMGLLRDTKPKETRVAVLPKHIKMLVDKGVTVLVQRGSGVGSGYSDEMYAEAGGQLHDDAVTLYEKCSLLVRVKAPTVTEVKAMKKGQTMFTYLHFDENAPPTYARTFESTKVTSIAYEWVEADAGQQPKFPLLYPMSVMAGVSYGVMVSQLMGKHQKLLPGGYVKGSHPHAVVIGCGVMGSQVCAILLRNNFKVVLFVHHTETLEMVNERILTMTNISKEELRAAERSGEEEHDHWGDEHQPGDLVVMKVDPVQIGKVTKKANIVVNCAVRKPGETNRYLLTREMQEQMPRNAIVCDATGCTDDFVQDSVAQDDLYDVEMRNGCVHYHCDHIPALFPTNASEMLADAVWPHLEVLATKGTYQALKEDAPLRRGAMTIDGTLCHKYCCEKKGLMESYKSPEDILGMK